MSEFAILAAAQSVCEGALAAKIGDSSILAAEFAADPVLKAAKMGDFSILAAFARNPSPNPAAKIENFANSAAQPISASHFEQPKSKIFKFWLPRALEEG